MSNVYPMGFMKRKLKVSLVNLVQSTGYKLQGTRRQESQKHYGFIQFESREVAKIVAETMQSYLLFEHLLQVQLVPPECVHLKIWKGFNYRSKPLYRVQIQ